MDQLRLFTLKYDLLKISVDLQTAFAAETHLAQGATERVKVTYVPSRNTNADCFQDRGAKLMMMIIININIELAEKIKRMCQLKLIYVRPLVVSSSAIIHRSRAV
jgi:hypothetical protein